MSYASKPLLAALALLVAPPVRAWNGVGHRAVAGVAYEKLNPQARARADEMLRRFPDYDLLLRESGAPLDPRARARAVFMMAAYWADMIKDDPRYYNEARRDSPPTPTLPGFPDMKRRQNWHYINIPITFDGTPVRQTPVPNVLTQLRVILDRIGNPFVGRKRLAAEEDEVYLLLWLLHLAGDVHQPLHCATRFLKGQNDPEGRPWSDLGGNTVMVVGAANLHALWDDALGITHTDGFVDGLVRTLLKRAPATPGDLDPAKWVEEGTEIAKRDVYSFRNQTGTKERPLRLHNGYVPRMRQVALERATLAGVRLAAVLNERLR
jgi:hypothetical protein